MVKLNKDVVAFEYVEGVGKASGKPYKAIRVLLGEKKVKMVFLSGDEYELLLMRGVLQEQEK